MILIVDDKHENIFSLKSILEANGFNTDTAGSGEEALKKILKNTYALIILDVQMPVMDGFEVAEAISGYSKAKDIPIIFLSAVNTDKRFIAKGYASGGIDYVTKPVDTDILLLKVKTFYRLYEQNKALQEAQAALHEEIEIRKQAQAGLTIKAQELQAILESIPQIAFTADNRGKIDFVNRHWYKYADIKTQFPATPPGEKNISDIWEQAIKKEDTIVQELCIKSLDSGQYCYHLLRVVPVIHQGKVDKWVGTFTDIHEQKAQAEILEQRVHERTKELQQINNQLEASNNDLQQFASVASHDLKEPLRKIQVFSSVVRDKFTALTEQETISYLNRIIDSSSRMDRLINDLLNYSRLSVSSLFTTHNLNEIINDIRADLEIAINEKQAVFVVDPIPDIEVIPGQIRQVFQNIISNALKFSKKHIHPLITIKAELIADNTADAAVASTSDAGYCRISISDNGIGFKEIYLDKIFTIFQRLNAQEEYEGTGIGLAIAKKIIEKHNGIITAKSIESEGTTFIIILPLRQNDMAAHDQ